MAVVGSGQATRQATFLPEAVVTGETSERASGITTAVSRGNITCLVEYACGCVGSGCGRGQTNGADTMNNGHFATRRARVIARVDR